MPFPEDLLDLARELVEQGPADPTQARLRRAVSTAYYALFHLLIDEAVSKWSIERQRSILARTFEHGKMKKMCEAVLKKDESGGDVLPALLLVAETFIRLQQHRHTADYDNSKQWSRIDVQDVLSSASDAFEVWRGLNDETSPYEPGRRAGFPTAVVSAEAPRLGHGRGRGVASPLTKPSDHLTASRYIACTSGLFQLSAVWPNVE